MEQNTCADKKIIIKNYEEITEVVPEGDDIYVVIMTLGYRTDLVVLKKLAARTFAYLGLLGSASKVATLMDEMKASGFMERDLKKIHAPLGIRINSHTPEEIAVSIAAEIIGVKNKG